ncbi:hypothetical protein [uncultured Croceitalea sp.]|uniref:hypothetical protein n=1 Tax=uncultured Croceitalea sp. TaxID=1798908 RepID=UPI00374E26D4
MKTINQILNIVKQSSPILYWVVIIHFIFTIGCLIGLTLDERTLMGVNVWIKPLKFSISGGIYILTLGFLTTLYPFSRRKKNIITNIVAITLFLEIVIVLYQAARGVQSHYNMSSPFDGILFGSMGILIAINVFIMVVFIVETIRLKLNTTKSIQWAILLGWIIVVFGSWVGGQMISQMGHNVGVADGGAGLPLVNWSTIAGDLRIAHFFGLHSIQLIPLFALWASKKWNNNVRTQLIAVTIFGILYASWIAFTFYQAKQGMALIQL